MREIRMFPEIGESSVFWEAYGDDMDPSAAELGLSQSLAAALGD